MTERSVIHDTFSIERTYPVPPAEVFTAFASEEARTAWGDADGIEIPADAEPSEFDFRAGGRERFTVAGEGSVYRYEALYYDIVPGQRIVYSYEMYQDGARISVSLATIEFGKSGDGTAMTWTEQGAYLDGIDGADVPVLRREGTAGMLDGLATYLARHPAAGGQALIGAGRSGCLSPIFKPLSRRATEPPSRAAAGSPPSARQANRRWQLPR